jgi:hypothetical protein
MTETTAGLVGFDEAIARYDPVFGLETHVELGTGRDPGRPRHTGHTWVLGAPPNVAGQPQKSLVLVPSSTWVSRPISGSYLDTASS